MWTFYINNIEVEEPIGWDAVEFVLQRSDEFVGLENIFSEQSLKFYNKGAELITSAFESDGIDGELEFKVTEACEDGDTTATYTINLVTYNEEEDGVSVKIERSDFDRKFKNRYEVPVNFDSTIALDGEDLSDYSYQTVRLHSKEIYKQSSLKPNEALLEIDAEDTFTSSPSLNWIYFPFQLSSNELSSAYELSDLFKLKTSSAAAWQEYFKCLEPGADITVDYKLKGTLIDICNDTREFTYVIRYDYGLDGSFDSTLLEGRLTTPVFYNQDGGIISISFDIEGSFTVPYVDNREILLYISLSNYRNYDTVSPDPTTFQLTIDESSYLRFNQVTQYDASTARVILPFEAFSQASEYITGVKDCFRSEFFGRTNSYPFSYQNDGCGAYASLTNGLNIRKMLQKNGENYPVVASFKDLFDAYNAVFNLGLRIYEESGKRYIQVEPKSYFFRGSSSVTLADVSEVSVTPALDVIYNEFEIGYRKFETEEINGIDEFNTRHNYSVPVLKAKKKLSQICNFIAGGFAIEQTRRQQYLEKPTTDWKYDNDNFIVCLNPSSVTSDEYGEGSQTYTKGTVSERNENFSSISNIFKPETCYNLRLTPARNANNWLSWVLASIYTQTNRKIKFLSGLGNVLVETTLNEDCTSVSEVVENADLSENNIQETLYFHPIYVNLSYPLTLKEFHNLESQSDQSVTITGCKNLSAFIKEVKYKPCEGVADFKLLVSVCLSGEFDSAFDDSFTIGTC